LISKFEDTGCLESSSSPIQGDWHDETWQKFEDGQNREIKVGEIDERRGSRKQF
jgi:hypothetical protein